MRPLLLAPLRHWKRWLPLVGSAALLGAVVWRVSPSKLAEALAELNFWILAPLSIALVAALYLWDSLCLWWLFDQPRFPLSYRATLRARGLSYLFTIINYGVGQGFLAWFLAQAQQKSFVASAARCAMITYIDLCVLLSLGLIGSSLSDDPRTAGIRWFCAVALSCVLATTLAAYLLPKRWIAGLWRTRYGAALREAAWHRKELALLAGMRLIYTSFGLVYVVLALSVCGIPLATTVVVSVVPLVALVDGLPISVGGFGTRDMALLVLLAPPDPATLVAFSIVWSTFGLGGRAAIGLVHLWLPGRRAAAPTGPT